MRFAVTAVLAGCICAACGSLHATPRPLHVGRSYLGLDCRHHYPCGHLGIALWLTGPQRRVTVTIQGRRVSLATHRGYEYRRYWQGFVHDTAAENGAGDMTRRVRLSVLATGLDGTVRRATLESPVSPGWG